MLKDARDVQMCYCSIRHSIDLSAAQQLQVNELGEILRNYLMRFLRCTNENTSEIAKLIDDVRPKIRSQLEKYRTKESLPRTASKTALLYNFAVKIVEYAIVLSLTTYYRLYTRISNR